MKSKFENLTSNFPPTLIHSKSHEKYINEKLNSITRDLSRDKLQPNDLKIYKKTIIPVKKGNFVEHNINTASKSNLIKNADIFYNNF